MRNRALLLTSLLCGCGGSGTTGSSTAEKATQVGHEGTPEVLVELSAAADVTGISPGQEFTVAAVMDIEPGWHVHWDNPGETGLRTTAAIRAPEGFDVGELRYPGPERFEARGAVSYGYQHRAVLSAKVTAPDSLGPGPVQLSIEADWLACKTECVRGKGTATLTLTPATAASPASPTNQVLFMHHEARLPRPLDALDNARHVWRSSRSGSELVIYVDGGAQVIFFPTHETQNDLVGQALVPAEGVGALHLSFRGSTPGPVRGVMHATDGRNAHYFAVDLPGPAAVAR